MKSFFYHLQININFDNRLFYTEMMHLLGWEDIFEDDDLIGFTSKNGDLWFVKSEKLNPQDYDSLGVNHISIRVAEQNNIDEFMGFLNTKKISSLFDTPRHRKEFAVNETETYYQIMFESPDKILFEIVYIGLK